MDQNVAGPEFLKDGSSAQISPWWLIRCGRGRVGGSTFLNFAIEWGRNRGRRVKPLDGDLRSPYADGPLPDRQERRHP